MSITSVLWWALVVIGVAFVVYWGLMIARKSGFALPNWIEVAIGFVTNFFDTLGIGSFAPTTSLFKFFKLVPDEKIPGTLNVGHTPPTIVEALAFIAIVGVDPVTLVTLIAAAVLGAWLGAGVVAQWPRKYVQVGMGCALIVAAALFVMKNLSVNPSGAAMGLSGSMLLVGAAMNFCFGALMTIGIGLYAPAMIMVGLLGMNPAAAFPIMMGSCAFLMPTASLRFMKFDAYSLKAGLGLTLGGIPGVLLAVKLFSWFSQYVTFMRWAVIVVVLLAAFTMLRSAYLERQLVPAGAEEHG